MVRVRRVLPLAAALAVTLAVAAGPVVGANPTMTFGRPTLGTGCAPGEGCEHDASFHSVDKINPRSVDIDAGATVDFAVEGFHEVAVYPAGTKPADVAIDPAAFPFVGSGAGTIHIAPPGAPTSYTFAQPGKYLVICYVAPHFEFANMWGYVTVR
jgi:plastocyanin